MTQATRRCTSLSPVSHTSVPLNVLGLFVRNTSTSDGSLFLVKQVASFTRLLKSKMSHRSVRGALFSLLSMLKFKSPSRITLSKFVKATSRALVAHSTYDLDDCAGGL